MTHFKFFLNKCILVSSRKNFFLIFKYPGKKKEQEIMKQKEAEAKQEKVDMKKKISANNFFKRALCVVCFMSPYASVILPCLHLKNNLTEYKILKLYLLSPK